MFERPSQEQLRAALNDLPEDLGAFQESLRDSLHEAASAEYTSSAADGAVEATCNGLGVLISVRIHPTARRELDNLTLGDAVAQAVRGAEDAGRRAVQERMGSHIFGGRPLTAFVPTVFDDPADS